VTNSVRVGLYASLLALLLSGASLMAPAAEDDRKDWFDPGEVEVIRSLWIGTLPPLPDDPSNRVDTDPRAAALGRKLFNDPRFSKDGRVSCATCHPHNVNFVDDIPLAQGIGVMDRRSMPLTGVGYNTWFFWDGRKDSLWSQALGPLESEVEHGITRSACFHLLRSGYAREYEELFGPLPDITEEQCPIHVGPHSGHPGGADAWERLSPEVRGQINKAYANMGKAIAAFVRLIVPAPSKFDHFAESLAGNEDLAREILDPVERSGLKLFIGKGGCTSCHFGPMLTNSDFHALLVPPRKGHPPDPGRAKATDEVATDEFNCLGEFSDASGREECAELAFMETEGAHLEGAFKTPSLRNVTQRRFYMHAGQLEDLDAVLDHYAKVGSKVPELRHGSFQPGEREALKAFLRTLSSPALIKSPFDETIPLPEDGKG
jgi:cytochrome c peroxidase